MSVKQLRIERRVGYLGLGLTAALAGVLLAVQTAQAQNPKVARWEEECAEGRSESCLELARAHRRGKENLFKNAERAAAYYRQACERDHPGACQEYGEALLEGAEGIALDTALAIRMFYRACRDDPEGKAGGTLGIGGRRRCDAISALYELNPPESRRDSVDAKHLMNRACQRGKIDKACELVSGPWTVFPDSVPLPDSVKLAIRREAERRDSIAKAEAEAARLAEEARLEEQRRIAEQQEKAKKAEEELRRGRRGNQAAEVRNRGIRRRSCDAGDAAACIRLAEMFEQGIGGAVDRPRAAELRKRACELDPKRCGGQGAS